MMCVTIKNEGKKIRLVNLGDKVENIIVDESEAICIPPSGIKAYSCGNKIAGIPAPQQNTYYILPAYMASLSGRNDILYPDDHIWNDDGIVVGARFLRKAVA